MVKVVDGETLDVDCPDGDRDSTRIRLRGVDTPRNPARSRGPVLGQMGHVASFEDWRRCLLLADRMV